MFSDTIKQLCNNNFHHSLRRGFIIYLFFTKIIPFMPTAKETYQDKYIKQLIEIIKCLRADVCAGNTPCTKPIITLQPQSAQVETGTDITLSVTATGSDLTYQWRKDGVDIDGATSAELVFEDLTLEDAANYYVVVANECGILTSNIATLETAEELLTYYWGWRTSETLANSDVEVEGLQFSDVFIPGNDIIADFTDNSSPNILIMAEPIGEPVKTLWYASPFNNGNIGDPDNDLFNYITTTSYRVYYTIYPTQQTQTNIQFQIVAP